MGILGDKFKTKSHEVRGILERLREGFRCDGFKNKVYEIRGTEGEWDDRADWSEGAFFSEVLAKQTCYLLNKEVDNSNDNYDIPYYYVKTILVMGMDTPVPSNLLSQSSSAGTFVKSQ
ncbi:MAG: hypothetical protein CMO16_07360, partial [Thaumarchaeota archaeon]|nr:hypothetical protein [Nitrososphaerota archaeon]